MSPADIASTSRGSVQFSPCLQHHLYSLSGSYPHTIENRVRACRISGLSSNSVPELSQLFDATYRSWPVSTVNHVPISSTLSVYFRVAWILIVHPSWPSGTHMVLYSTLLTSPDDIVWIYGELTFDAVPSSTYLVIPRRGCQPRVFGIFPYCNR